MRTIRDENPMPFLEDSEGEAPDDALDCPKWNVELSLKLTPAKGKNSVTFKILAGEFPTDRIQEVLEIACKSRRTKQIVGAVLDDTQEESGDN